MLLKIAGVMLFGMIIFSPFPQGKAEAATFSSYSSTTATRYKVTEITGPSISWIYPEGINNNGQVVGRLYSTATGVRAFVYKAGDLQTLGTISGWDYGRAINNLGQVVGGSILNYDTPSQPHIMHASVSVNGSLTDLGTLGGDTSDAYGINDLGGVVGYSYTTNGEIRAFLYSNATMQDLGTLGGNRSFAFGINNAGEVVGWSSTSTSYRERAFVYKDGTMRDLGTLGGESSDARGINDLGHITGWSTLPGDAAIHAFIYKDGIFQDIGQGLSWDSYALDINNSDHAVGGINEPGTNNNRATVCRSGIMQDLNNLLQGDIGIVLDDARGINDFGQIVAAANSTNGNVRAFLLTPITPPVSFMVPSGIAGYDGWFKSNVTASLVASDDDFGVKEIRYAVDGGAEVIAQGDNVSVALDTEGVHSISYYAIDKSGAYDANNPGNIESSKSGTVKIDMTAPTSSVSLIGSVGNNNWFTSDVTVFIAASDAVSGGREIRYSLNGGNEVVMSTTNASFVINTEGVHTVTYYSVDNAGNIEPAKTVTLSVDKFQPSVSIMATPSAIKSTGSGKMVDVVLTGAATDSASGIATIVVNVVDEYGIYNQNLTGYGTVSLEGWKSKSDVDGRTYTITAVATDNAGIQQAATTIVTVQ